VKNHFKDVDEEFRLKVLSFVFYRNLIRIQNFAKACLSVYRQASNFIKNIWREKSYFGQFRHGKDNKAIKLFRKKIMLKKLCRWFKWQCKKLRLKRNPFIFDKPMKYSLRKLLTI
jgi:hypothetical protein